MVTPEYSPLDILNTAVATVYGKSINILLKQHWENELKYVSRAYGQPNSSASSFAPNSDNKNQQSAANNQPTALDELPPVGFAEQAQSQASRSSPWSIFGRLATKEAEDTRNISTSEFIHRVSP